MAKRTKDGRLLLTEPAEVRATAGAVPHQLISVLERERRGTVTELAGHLGLPPGSLYYHVRKLRDAGILLEGERRTTGGRDEVVYELAGREVVYDPEANTPPFLTELARTIRTRLRWLERACVKALSHPKTLRKGKQRNLMLAHHHARLGPRDRAELHRRIEELEAFLQERDDPRREDFVHVTFVMVPMAPR